MEYHTNTVTSADLVGSEPVVNDETLGRMFEDFVSNFRTDEHVYANALGANALQKMNRLSVQLEHIALYNQKLYEEVLRRAEHAIRVFEKTLRERLAVREFQVEIVSNGPTTGLRELSASKANRIVKVEGIVVSCTPVRTKPKELCIMCKSCLETKFVKETIPRVCDRPECPVDPYIIVPEKSRMCDVQYGKIQESFENIPVGEVPRHCSILLEDGLVDQITPGNKVTVTGILLVRSQSDKSSTHIKVIGIESNRTKLKKYFTAEEETLFRKMAAQENIYERVAKSIAPGIFGHIDVKKAIACLLFGGTRRLRSDGISLRGEINVLLLGDPGIAKSQLLKFVHQVAPVGVYTSGKGSSAAGLTAAVTRDRHGEFFLEGGAMVLADNGVCCIDEFDKMNEKDRVAIHEAMEQQTISIAKAGITTMLRTRTAVLAAANPVFGRYDDFRTPFENIEFGSTILSRFDLIFILKDKSGPSDRTVAEHVLSLHKPSSLDPDTIPIDLLRSYIHYARSKIFPVISLEASERLSRFYVSARQEVRDLAIDSAIPVTVRQLEAIIRVSEAIARIELRESVSLIHVDEAIRLFQLSTMSAVSQGHLVEGMVHANIFDEIHNVIARIKECMPVGVSRRFSEILKETAASELVVKKAVECMIKQNKMISKDYGRVLVRLP